MSAALIGVTSSYSPPDDGPFGTVSVGESYIQAILHAGGVPVVIPVGIAPPVLDDLYARLDGFLLTGGADIDPQRFGGAPHPRIYGVDARRDALEIALVRWAAVNGKPFLGICRGVQVINVALGGSLFTDITDQKAGALRHDWFPNHPRDLLAHPVTLVPGSRLAQILGEDVLEVNSLHHQGVERLAPALHAVAHAPDGLVEAVELPDHPFGFGVQWHPEWIQAHAPQRMLLQRLVRAASGG
jgi:putative glutamine amidotransferase